MKFILLLCLLLSNQLTQASHLAGGYIQTKAVGSNLLTYEVTVVLYLNETVGATGAASQDNVLICLGDGNTRTAPRSSRTFLSNRLFSVDVYRTTYTYAGPGTYNLLTIQANRSDCRNIATTQALLLTLSTTIFTGTNRLNQTPTPGFPQNGFYLGVNQRATVALAATDSEGDSLVYSLAKPYTGMTAEGCNRQTVTSYRFPNDVTQRGIYQLNNRTGELTWDAPVTEGRYSVALNIDEYRNGILISETTQEILFIVADLPGTASQIPPYEPARQGTALVTALEQAEDTGVRLTVFPNPVDDRLQVVIQTSDPATATVRLLDINGRKLHELNFPRLTRRHEQVISLGSLSPGVYIIQTDSNGRSLQRKIMKR